MPPDVDLLVTDLHKTPHRTVIATSGAGTYAVAWLLGVSGASNTVLEALSPYSFAAFDVLLGRTPKQYVNEKIANWLAGRALTRAQLLSDSTDIPLIGLSCTATIATNYPKKGDHRAHITAWTPDRVHSMTLIMAKNQRTRLEEEALVSRAMLNLLAKTAGLTTQLDLHILPDDEITQTSSNLAHSIQDLLSKTVDFVGIYDTGRVRTKNINPEVVLSGSFNPLHKGHLELAKTAESFLGKPVAFELAVSNADKPALSADETAERASQFAGRYPIYLTNEPTFLGKARLFPNTVFVVGFDTAERILNPKYYDDFDEAMTELRALNTQFLVASRVDKSGDLRTADSLTVPSQYSDLFIPLPDFRQDISSTALRAENKPGAR